MKTRSKKYSARKRPSKKRPSKKLSKKLSRKRLSKTMSCNVNLYKNLRNKKRLTPYEENLLEKIQGCVYLKTKEDGKSFSMPFKLPPGWKGIGTMGNDSSDTKTYPHIYDYYGPKCTSKLAAEKIRNGAKKIKSILKFKVQIKK